MSRRLALSVLVLIAAALVGCRGEEAKPSCPSAAKAASELRVADQREIMVDDGRIVALSPDGKWLVISRETALCVCEVPSQAEQCCVEIGDEVRNVDLGSIAWSPDSTRVVFTEEALRLLYESDLWVLEVETGHLKNLTDDGVTGGLLTAKGEAAIDVAPGWSRDGRRLVFSRSPGLTSGEREGTSLYSIPASGGNPRELLTVDDQRRMSVWSRCHYSGDGKQILYTVASGDSGDPENGVWIAAANGGTPQQVLGATDLEKGLPYLMDVSSQGDRALVGYQYALEVQGLNSCAFFLLDLKTGEIEPVKQAKGDATEFLSVENATLSPDGSKVLYIYHCVDDEQRLAVRDVDGDTEHILLALPTGMIYYAWSFGPAGSGLDWAQSDTIYVSQLRNHGLLLSLETD